MTEQPSATKPSGARTKIIVAVALAVGVGGAWKGFMGDGTSSAAPSTSGASATTTTHPGPVVTLEPFTTNVAGGRYLKVGLALQLPGDAAEDETADSDDPTKGYARAVDLAIDTLSGRDVATLVTPAGRDAARDELLRRLHEAYGEEVEDVYFTQFIVS